MKYIKNKKILLYLGVLILLGVVIVAFGKASYAYPNDAIGNTTYRDFDSLSVLDYKYSYSTIFLTEQSTITLIKRPTYNGSPASDRDYIAEYDNYDTSYIYEEGYNPNDPDKNTKIRVPNIGFFDSGEAAWLITKAGVDPYGEPMDVVVKVNNVSTYGGGGYADFYMFPAYDIMYSQSSGNIQDHYYKKVTVGDPLMFWLNTVTAEMDFELTYYKSGTYDPATDTGVKADITNVISFYHDFDVPASGNYSGYFMDGNEGMKPTVGVNTIFWNKNNNDHPPENIDFNKLKERDNGIAVDTVSANTNGIFYQNSVFLITENVNAHFRFHYGGTGCGIGYLFVSPYPFSLPSPIKKLEGDKDTFWVGEEFTYKVGQYVPNNYFGQELKFNEVFPSIWPKTRLGLLEISDTLNQFLEIQSGITVVDEDDNDVSYLFNTPVVSGQTVSVTATASAMEQSTFYSHTYYLKIPVKISVSATETTIPNTGRIRRQIQERETETVDTNTVNVYIEPVRILVHHYEWDGIHNTGTVNPICSDQVTYDVHYNQHYTTESCRTPVEYELYITPDNHEGYATEHETVVTYYYIRKSKLIVNHFEYDGINSTNTSRKLCDSIEEDKLYGQTYQTSACQTVPTGYKLVATPGNANGTVQEDQVVVNYYYNREGKLTVYHYEWDGFNNLETTNTLCTTEESNHAFGTQYNTSACTPPSSYRFYKVEEDRTKGDAPSGIISKFDTVVKYYYINRGTLNVHHYRWDLENNRGTIQSLSPDQVTNNLDYGTTYTTSQQNINDYTLYMTYGDPINGRINKPVTDVIYYYAPLANLTVHHYLKNSTTSLCDDLISTVNYFDDYSTEVCQNILDTYRYVSVTSNDTNSTISNQVVTGRINRASTVVTYYYELKPATVTVHHYKWDVEHDTGTTNKLCDDVIINSTYTATYNTTKCDNLNDNSYKFMKVESTDPDTNIVGDTTNGTINKDNIVITYYYDYKPAKVTTHHYIVDSSTKVAPDDVTNTTYNVHYETNNKTSDQLSEAYRDWYEYVDVHTGDPVSGTVNKDEMVVNYYYDRMHATVIAHHYIKGTTTKLAEDDTYHLRFHDHYETNYKQSSELSNTSYQYESVVGDDPEGTVNKALIEVTYYYNAIPAKLIVHHYKEGTTESICEDLVDESRLYHETYETHACENMPDTHNEFKSVISDDSNSHINGSVVTGTFNQDVVTITYYYGLKPAQVITHHYEVGTTTQVHDDDIDNTKKHLDPYTTHTYESNVLNDAHKDWYYYINETAGDQPNGVIDKDVVEVIYYYDKKPATLTVHHYIEGTTTKLAEDEVYNDYKYHDSYETHYKSPEELNDSDYIYKNYGGDPVSGTINKDNVEVIYYYALKPANVIVHHYIEGTTTKLCEDINSSKHYKDEYNTVVCDNLNDHAYKFKEVISDDSNSVIDGSNVSGIVKQDTITVIYYYDLKPAKVNVHHYIEGTTTKLCEDSSQDKLYKDSYETNQCTDLSDNDYKYKNVVTDDPNSSFNGSIVTGTIDQDVVEVIYYYELKPANIIVHHYIDGTTTKLCEDENIMHKFKDHYDINLCTNLSDPAYKFKEVNSTDISSTINGSKVTGTVTNNFEVTYYYDLKSSQIIVHHLELDTHRKLAPDVLHGGLVYEHVTISEVNIDGYRLVQKPENEDIEFTIEDQEFTYYYVRLKYNIDVEVIEGEGGIEGEEIIYHGDDSTPEKIVITPHEEWEISKIIVDGEEIEVTDKDHMVVENFKKVVTNHKVQVIFVEKPIPVPITGSKTKLIIASIIIAVMAILAVVKVKFLKKKEN